MNNSKDNGCQISCHWNDHGLVFRWCFFRNERNNTFFAISGTGFGLGFGLLIAIIIWGFKNRE